MSLINSVLGSLSPKFRSSFEDPRANEHELPRYTSPPVSPRIPPPIASTILWSAPKASLSPPTHVPDDIVAIQRRARHLEQQLQELLDAQAEGLTTGLAGNDSNQDDLISNGSTTPTVSSVRGTDRSANIEAHGQGSQRKVGLSHARRGIFRRIQQLARVKAEEMDLLDADLQDLHAIVQKTEGWAQKRVRLERRIRDIESESSGTRTVALQDEASKLEQEIRLKEEELWALKRRHRRIQDDMAETENSKEAKLSSYKASLAILDKDVSDFLAHPPITNHVPLSESPFLSLQPKRRTLQMSNEYWQEEHDRLFEKCQEVDMDRAALDEGAVLWNTVVKKVTDFEVSLQDYMQQAALKHNLDPSNLLTQMEATISYLDAQLDIATSKSWNLLVCAIGAELEAFKQGKEILETALGIKSKGKGKASTTLVDTEHSHDGSEEEGTSSAIRINRSSISRSPPKSSLPAKPKFFDTDDEDPDPELMISHQDTDTD